MPDTLPTLAQLRGESIETRNNYIASYLGDRKRINGALLGRAILRGLVHAVEHTCPNVFATLYNELYKEGGVAAARAKRAAWYICGIQVTKKKDSTELSYKFNKGMRDSIKPDIQEYYLEKLAQDELAAIDKDFIRKDKEVEAEKSAKSTRGKPKVKAKPEEHPFYSAGSKLNTALVDVSAAFSQLADTEGANPDDPIILELIQEMESIKVKLEARRQELLAASTKAVAKSSGAIASDEKEAKKAQLKAELEALDAA
jgi:hypothetical protein